MKAYKFLAWYKRLEKKAPGIEFTKTLHLTPQEVALAKEDGPKFLTEQVEKGQLPKGYYSGIRLLDWKTKVRWPSEVKKKSKRGGK